MLLDANAVIDQPNQEGRSTSEVGLIWNCKSSKQPLQSKEHQNLLSCFNMCNIVHWDWESFKADKLNQHIAFCILFVNLYLMSSLALSKWRHSFELNLSEILKMTMKMKTPGKYLQAFLRARCRSCLTPMALGLGMEAAQTLNTEGKILFYIWRNTFWYRGEFKLHSLNSWTLTTDHCKNHRGNTLWN